MGVDNICELCGRNHNRRNGSRKENATEYTSRPRRNYNFADIVIRFLDVIYEKKHSMTTNALSLESGLHHQTANRYLDEAKKLHIMRSSYVEMGKLRVPFWDIDPGYHGVYMRIREERGLSVS